MDDSDNLDTVMGQLTAIINSFDFTRPGADESLGKDCAMAIAQDIVDQSARQQTPDQQDFPRNAPEYAEWKGKKYGFPPPAYGYRTGQTLSLNSVAGEIDVRPDEVVLKYGKGQPPNRSSASEYITDADKSITDIEKMYFAFAQRGIDVMKIGPDARDAVMAEVREALTKHLQEHK